MKCNECNRAQSNLRHNQILIWLCILSFFSVLNEMVLNVSLPDIANDFNKPPASTNWVNTAFMLTFSIGTAVYGKLSDQLGIKRLLMVHDNYNRICFRWAFVHQNSYINNCFK